ncbi:MAG: hypothetical protein COC08_00530 [Maribacter sp.]|nr:MAG: hypothetical protein COC08_00530 [Maribacter sp.]
MSEKYLFLINILELITAILATVFFSKYVVSKEKYFLYFLWFTLGVELCAALMSYVIDIDNFWIYNFYTIISFLFYFYWYHAILKQVALQRAVLVFGILFTGVAIWNLVFQSWTEYHQYTFVVGALFTLVATLFHFWQLLYSDQILVIQYKLSFWISAGLLLFYMGMVPFMLLSRYFELAGASYYILIISLNCILYGCYIIGFLWTKEKYNRF